MTDNIVLITGGFDSIHPEHISFIKEASKLGRVIVGLNSDECLTKKKDKPVMNFQERKYILEQLKGILCVLEFDDSDNTSSDAIQKVIKLFPNNKIIFIKNEYESQVIISEIEKFKDNFAISFCLGRFEEMKNNNFNHLISKCNQTIEKKIWGDSITCYSSENTKVKRLIIEPKKSISMQYHLHRNELWFVESGSGTIYTYDKSNIIKVKDIYKHEMYHVPVKKWHKLESHSDTELCIVEIQYGNLCVEKDIVRL